MRLTFASLLRSSTSVKPPAPTAGGANAAKPRSEKAVHARVSARSFANASLDFSHLGRLTPGEMTAMQRACARGTPQ
jgi:hypothetical protein